MGLTKVEKGSTTNGYILFAPLHSKTTYLIDKCGNTIKSWRSNYLPGYSAYLLPDGSLLRTGAIADSFFRFSGKGGIIEKFDWDGNLTWSYKISNDSLAQHHDIRPMDNGNILVLDWHKIPQPKAEAAGRLPGTIGGPFLASERILEIKPEGTNKATVIWQWTLWDHIAQDWDINKPNFYLISDHPELFNVNYETGFPDWLHLNAIDYNKKLDQILLSNHRMNEIWIIDHSTTSAEAASHKGGKYGMGGDILYRWGNPAAYNKGSKADQKLFHQHNAQWTPEQMADGCDIILFNNGIDRTPLYSSIDIISPPSDTPGYYKRTYPMEPANIKWSYKDPTPDNFYSYHLSGVQRLPNGNTLICDGVKGVFFEINKKNKVVWEYINPVATGDTIMIDGTKPVRNKVFKCTYYSHTYSAFQGKKISSGLPIEKNSYPKKCKSTVNSRFKKQKRK